MKGNLLQGTARGRMGDIVAKVVHGEQIFSKYQPNVTNPDSPKQKEVRRKFRSISSMLAVARKKLAVKGINPRYNHVSGASKSLQNIIFPYAFEHAKIQEADGNNFALLSKNPTMSKGYTGNILHLEMVDNELALGGMGEGYFGSEKQIPEGTITAFSFGSRSNSNLPGLSVYDLSDFWPELQDRKDFIGEPRGYGIQQNIDDVGDWPYIYKAMFGFSVGAFCQPIPYNNTQNQIGTGVIIYDKLGGIIYSDYYHEKVNATVTP